MRMSERVPYQAFVDRPKLQLPNGARVAVWFIVNVEEWAIERPMPRKVLPAPMGEPLMPDLANWAWHEYGMRVGFWRIFEALQKRKLPVTMALNGNIINSYPRIAQAALEAGWEFMGHGFVQRPMHHLEDEREQIFKTVETIRGFTGKQPVGWESPGLTETEETLHLLREAGIEYVANWVVDDLPCELATRHGPMLSVPYSVETNDIVVHAVQQLPSDAFMKRCIDQFDRLYADGEDNVRVMAISLHPYLTGVPHRIGYFEKLVDHILGHDKVAWMTGEQIAEWYREAAKAD
ncbi:polysaccharide deacetylase family protein [Aureimonas fodinaquatilis]|uniref:Chitooligosaccharide deacetylase n=1 Tax=Aureimonas fodinaquatilis TaxID=2565783 RepID=A0A5B0DUG1_9HYPH|nr:polysaccharide deacetylase family protein [Aureimonas fodinaquatilis]KAA0969575.1 polysaccharide deacetylase family protein [Aureimonas fodinaquatilis]